MVPTVVEGAVQELWRRRKKDPGIKDTFPVLYISQVEFDMAVSSL
jgi:hypothetical protein